MADQDAQDINQMMSARPEVAVAAPKKSRFLWVVLGCVVFGVGLGVMVYQQSIKPKPTPSTTLKPTPKASSTTAITPETNVVTPTGVTQPLPNTMTFPESGKVRVYSSLPNLQLLITLNMAGVIKTITLPARPITTTNVMNYTDATFEVSAGSTASISANLNKDTGPKMGGWILPVGDTKCGVTAFMEITPMLTWAQANLAPGKTIFAKQCWSDTIDPKDPSSYDFNDFFLAWSYSAGGTTASPIPSTSPVSSSSPSPSVSPSPAASKSPSPSPSPSPSVKASVVPSPTPTPTPTPTTSPRVSMPDTSEGTPVTGVFEVTVGTISVGLVLLMLGLFGLLAL